jgi:hypothetical protein
MEKNENLKVERRVFRKAEDVAVEVHGDIVSVPLAGAGHFATLDKADYDRLVADGISLCWVLGTTGNRPGRHPGVKVRVADKAQVPVGRLILGATPNHRLVYASGDRTDLRRANISLKEVAARGEGDGGSGVMRRPPWKSIARDDTAAGRRIAAKKAAAEAGKRSAYAAYVEFRDAQDKRVTRAKAWMARQIATGMDRHEAQARAMALSQAERRAWCEARGLDPATGKLVKVAIDKAPG